MVIHLVAGIDVGELLALHWCIVGRIVETVAVPGCTRELGPLDMVIGQLSRLQVDDVELLPVAAGARHSVSHVLAVVREIRTLQGYGAVGAQLVGVKEYARLTAQLVHDIHDRLVLQPVIFIEVPLAVTLPWRAHFLVVGQFRQSFEQFLAEGYFLQVAVGHLILCLHPCCRLAAGVVLQPSVGVGNRRAEIIVYGAVLRGFRILYSLCRCQGRSQCCNSDDNQSFHVS